LLQAMTTVPTLDFQNFYRRKKITMIIWKFGEALA
jgi:hypothetical protein